MNLNTLNEFRHEVYGCFKRAGDALFNTVDALSSETAAHSFPELSLSPFFQRKWASAYEAFEDGQIDAERLRHVFVQFAPLAGMGQHVFLGIDTSNLYRPQANTSADRTMVPLPNLPECDHAVSAGWVGSLVVLLPQEAGQGTFVLESRRVTSSELATEVAASQLRAVVDLLVQRGLRPVIIGDRWYACARWQPVVSCASNAIASFTVALQLVCRVSAGQAPKMEPGFNAAMRARMAKRMPTGRGRMPKASASKCAAGTSCICARLERSR